MDEMLLFADSYLYSLPLWCKTQVLQNIMAKNERTSEEIASIASKILNMKNPGIITADLWDEIQSVAGSVLTQAPDEDSGTSKKKFLPIKIPPFDQHKALVDQTIKNIFGDK